MTSYDPIFPLVADASSHPAPSGWFFIIGPESGAPIDAKMPIIDAAETLAACHRQIATLLAAGDADRVFLLYWARMRDGGEVEMPRTLGELLEDSAIVALHLVAVSQRTRHRISGLEGAAALFGVFGSEYLVLGAHFLGVSPTELVRMLEHDELSSPLQKVIAAVVAHVRPFAENRLIEAVERIELMLPEDFEPEGAEPRDPSGPIAG